MKLDLIKTLLSLLVIINPLNAIPIYISLTARHASVDRTSIINTTSIAVAIILIAAALIGEPLIQFLGISIGSFQIGGGILVLLLAINMVNQPISSNCTQEQKEKIYSKENIAVVPLALPLLAGPGAISTMIIAAHKATDWKGLLFLSLIAILIACIIWGALKLAAPISKKLGPTGINIATRIMSLFLMAISIEFIIEGLKSLLPILQYHLPLK